MPSTPGSQRVIGLIELLQSFMKYYEIIRDLMYLC